ncbi:hypothetical protein TFLX_02785 [Thermoflexales bacterium]|nr:hypothetical protein TFLX_02785 [Thermoflexales bacterium]
MATVSTSGAAVALGDVYALLLEDIRHNRAARLAAQNETAQPDHAGDDDTRADDTTRAGVQDGA